MICWNALTPCVVHRFGGCQVFWPTVSLFSVPRRRRRNGSSDIRDARVARVKDCSALVVSDGHDAPVSGRSGNKNIETLRFGTGSLRFRAMSRHHSCHRAVVNLATTRHWFVLQLKMLCMIHGVRSSHVVVPNVAPSQLVDPFVGGNMGQGLCAHCYQSNCRPLAS